MLTHSPFPGRSQRLDDHRASVSFRPRPLSYALGLSLAMMASSADVWAEGVVTGVLYEERPATPFRYEIDGETFTWGLGRNQIMTGLLVDGERFDYASANSRVELRRDDIAGVAVGNPCGVMVQRLDATGNELAADYPSDGSGTGNCDMPELLASRVINRGAVDLFSNLTPDAKNIERADFIFDQGIVAPLDDAALDGAGHTVGEKRGNNPVQMAAILELDAFGQAAAYGPLVRVNAIGCADSELCYAETDVRHRYAFFQNEFLAPQGFPTVTELSVETLSMAFVSARALGLQAGQRYYGFSLFADDVDAQLHTLTDPASFPDDTSDLDQVSGDDADIYGGLSGYLLGESLSVATGQVFLDVDGDGSFGSGDAGIGNIGIAVFEDSNGNGVFEGSTDAPLSAPIESGPDGQFQIPGLPDSDVFIVLDESDPDLPGGVTLSPGSNPILVPGGSGDVDDADFVFVSESDAGTTIGDADNGTLDDASTTAVADSFTINQGETLVAPVLDNDIDATGSGLSLVAVGDSDNASISIDGDNIIYTPDFGFFGTDSFVYTIEDSSGTQATGTVTVMVERFSDINNNGLNDFDECEAAGVDCGELRLETGVHGSGLGAVSVFGFLGLLLATGGAVWTRGRGRMRAMRGQEQSS